jgi:hypothetical protein
MHTWLKQDLVGTELAAKIRSWKCLDKNKEEAVLRTNRADRKEAAHRKNTLLPATPLRQVSQRQKRGKVEDAPTVAHTIVHRMVADGHPHPRQHRLQLPL